MVQIEPVETTLTLDVDKQSFARGLKFARDTGKKLDQELLRELQLNVVNAENKIRQIKSQLKKDLPRERKIELEIELQGLKSGLTQAKRELRNFENTGNKTASRLQKKFNGL